MKPSPISTLLAAIAMLLPAAGCAPASRHGEKADTTVAIDSVAAVDAEEAWVDSVLNSMSLQLKVGQLIMPAIYSKVDSVAMVQISDYADRLGVGGIVLLKGNVASAAAIADSVAALAPTGLFIAVDAETGLSMRFSDAPAFLWNSQISNDASEEDLYAYGKEVARECRLIGVNMVLGPVLDVAAGHSRFRSFGSDPHRVAKLGVAYARGLEDGGVLSVAKHFPGHGNASADSHKALAVVNKSREEMMRCDLLPFREYVKAGLSGVMVGHIYVPALDREERPASFSPAVTTGLLRETMQFGGLIITDAVNMGGAGKRNASDAIKAGSDIIIAPLSTERAIAGIVEEVEVGRIPESVIDEHCRRVLTYKYRAGIARRGSNRGNVERINLYSGTDTIRRALTDHKPDKSK